MTVPHVSACFAATAFGAHIIPTLLYHPLVRPSDATRSAHAAGESTSAGDAKDEVFETARNAGTKKSLAAEAAATVRGRYAKTSNPRGHHEGIIFPTTSNALKHNMRSTGYQSPSFSLRTSSANTPGKMLSVTAYTEKTVDA